MNKTSVFLLLLMCIFGCATRQGTVDVEDEASSPAKRDEKLGGSLIFHYYSEEKDNPAWQKDIITADGPDFSNLRDRQGILASKQETVAIEVATSNLNEMAVAYGEGFDRGIAGLVSITNAMPKTGFTMRLVLPLVPGESRTALEGFIVEHEYDQVRNYDKLSIHFTQSLSVEPKIVCPYITNGGFVTNNVSGKFRDSQYLGSNWTNKFTIVKGEVTYDNCHMLYVPRPQNLIGYTVVFNSNVRYGTDDGIDYGEIVHTAYGQELFNGTLTNHVNNTYVVIRDGAIMKPGFIPIVAEE